MRDLPLRRLLSRRDLLRWGSASAAALAFTPILPDLFAASGQAAVRGPLYRPPVLSTKGLTLTARGLTAEIAPGLRSPIMSLGDGPVAPTLRARSGERATITLINALSEPTILHWHGLRPPEAKDGHPRLAIDPGARYEYDFTVDEPAGLYWYHSHPHMRTGAQVHLGMAGLFVVTDAVERWVFINDGPFPHPVHMHAVHFRVISREGGRAQLFPWEEGWKDTVLVYPGEKVAVDATFDRHRGRFLMHCHNLEHEDHGMMMNFAVE
jgi:FtsP/CotA-like multicopper oxidase with cupredoxin domain